MAIRAPDGANKSQNKAFHKVNVSEYNCYIISLLSVTSICSGYLKLQILTFSQQISCKECGGPGGVQIARKTKCVETH